ncbi:hypothetical protein M2352_000107 [Azospirillum fermentarium]|uniref:hypothetical protein n=1 Tax=Azospirillum fermentarium TaxID=1233114 RepID=UPI002226B80B|nr:hypothetical protein [Azospirillum fermentarium]MCW2244516.1 hypothetical protein [Azospirillum fermentarium]
MMSARGAGVSSLFLLSDGFGPLARSLVEGRGFIDCTGTFVDATLADPCLRAHRLPLAAWAAAGLAILFADDPLAAGLAKAVVFVLPLTAAHLLAVRSAWRYGSAAVTTAVLVIPLAALMIPAVLINTVNMQVEEGYAYSLIAFAFAFLLFFERQGRCHTLLTGGFGLSLAGLYLTKSSFLPFLAFLLLFHTRLEPSVRLRALVVVLTLAGVLGWMVHSHDATGRWSLGTSIDGLNFLKGNNAGLIDHYPPLTGTLDRYDAALLSGKVYADEWSLNDDGLQRAIAFMTAEPRLWAILAWRKFSVLFLSVDKAGSAPYPGFLGVLERGGLVAARLLEAACLVALALAVQRRRPLAGRAMLLFLGSMATLGVPYIVGFAFTRHASMMFLPCALALCHALVSLSPGRADGTPS